MTEEQNKDFHEKADELLKKVNEDMTAEKWETLRRRILEQAERNDNKDLGDE